MSASGPSGPLVLGVMAPFQLECVSGGVSVSYWHISNYFSAFSHHCISLQLQQPMSLTKK